jgi:hypothetical protein
VFVLTSRGTKEKIQWEQRVLNVSFRIIWESHFRSQGLPSYIITSLSNESLVTILHHSLGPTLRHTSNESLVGVGPRLRHTIVLVLTRRVWVSVSTIPGSMHRIPFQNAQFYLSSGRKYLRSSRALTTFLIVSGFQSSICCHPYVYILKVNTDFKIPWMRSSSQRTLFFPELLNEWWLYT